MTGAPYRGLDLLGEPVLVFDDEGCILDHNDRVSELIGDAPERSVSDGDDGIRFEDGRSRIGRVGGSGGPTEGTAVVSFPTGETDSRRFSFNLRRLPPEESGAVIGVGRELVDAGTRRERHGAETVHGHQRTLAARERALRRAYDIIADSERSLDAKIRDMLRLVRETIGTDFATLSRIDGAEYTIEAIDGPPDVALEGPDGSAISEGDSVPLSFTNCQRVVTTTGTLVVEDIDADTPELADRPVNSEMGISCYLGTPVTVEGDNYGTFCFYDLNARSDRFTDWHVTFVELLGNWVGYELERERLMDRIRTEERERYETLVEQSSDGVVVVQDGTCVFANDRFLDLTGRDRDTVYCKSLPVDRPPVLEIHR